MIINELNYTHGQKIGELPVPELPGKEFVGWFTSGGEQINPDTQVNQDMTIYAQWSDATDIENSDTIPTYKNKNFTYDDNGTITTITTFLAEQDVFVDAYATSIGSAAFGVSYFPVGAMYFPRVTSIGERAFAIYGTSSAVTEVMLPAITNINDIGNDAFAVVYDQCLTVIKLYGLSKSDFTEQQVNRIGLATRDCTIYCKDGIVSVSVSQSGTQITSSNYTALTQYFNYSGTSYSSEQADVTLPSSMVDGYVTSIGNNVKLYNHPELKRIDFVNLTSLGSYGISNGSSTTTNNSLEYIYIGQGVTSLSGNSFNGCKKLKYIDLSNVNSISAGAFTGCSDLAGVTFGPQLTSLSNSAFNGCKNLKYIDLSMCTGLTSIQANAFDGCTSLVEVKLPPGLKSISNYAFANCANLKKIEFPDTITSIGVQAFKGCASLTEISLPPNIYSIPSGCFSFCTSLNRINLNGNTRLASIGSYAFSGCDSLTTVEFPEVTSVNVEAFSHCANLVEARFPSVQVYTNTSNVTYLNISAAAFFGCPKMSALHIDSVGQSHAGSYTNNLGLPYNCIIYCKNGYRTYQTATVISDNYHLANVIY